jgi:transcription elongation factor GreA
MVDGIKKIQKEVSALEHELHHVLPKDLEKARAHGDLSENAEYHAAKERQDFVSARLGQLRKRLADLSLVNFDNIPRDRVGLGSTVTLYDLERETEIEYKLVMSEEADVAKGFISTTSPIGRALIGKQAGDATTVQAPSGSREFEIVRFRTTHEDA